MLLFGLLHMVDKIEVPTHIYTRLRENGLCPTYRYVGEPAESTRVEAPEYQ